MGECGFSCPPTIMKIITIDLVDQKHIVARSSLFKNGAEVWHHRDENEAQEHLTKMLKQYEKLGYNIEIEGKGAFRLTKAEGKAKKKGL